MGVKGEATLGASVCIGRGATGGLPLYQTATCDKKSTSDYSHTACLSVTASSDAALTGVAIYVWHQIMIHCSFKLYNIQQMRKTAVNGVIW